MKLFDKDNYTKSVLKKKKKYIYTKINIIVNPMYILHFTKNTYWCEVSMSFFLHASVKIELRLRKVYKT